MSLPQCVFSHFNGNVWIDNKFGRHLVPLEQFVAEQLRDGWEVAAAYQQIDHPIAEHGQPGKIFFRPRTA